LTSELSFSPFQSRLSVDRGAYLFFSQMKTLVLGGFGEDKGKFELTPAAQKFDQSVGGKLSSTLAV
jgi:hypothetical protein